MSNQLVITSGAKVRSLEGVLTGTSGVVNSVPLGGANGVATLDSSGKVPLSQLPASVITYLGTWNAATNTPTLVNGTGDVGDLYICNVAGTVNFGAGPITFAVGDWVIYSGTTWEKSGGASGTVTSVAMTVPTGLSVTGSPITTSGTLAVSLASGYTIPTTSFLSGLVPYTGATQSVDLGAYDLNARGIKINGTGGLGHADFKHQSGTPTGSASSSTLYANTDGNLAWLNDHSHTITLAADANTADRTYTFPDASGTIALTSSLSSYVPYTGATSDVNLGSHDLTGTGDFFLGSVNSGGIFAEGPSGTDGYIFLKGNGTFGLLSVYNSIFANGYKYGFDVQGGTSGSAKRAYLDFGSLTNSITRTYSFPDSSGTLALTSDIPSLTGYVPYTGATGSVVLGSYNLTASTLFTSATADGGLWMNQASAITGGESSTTYTSIKAYTNRYLYFSFGQTSDIKRFRFDINGLTAGSTITYTMPNASGTLALTSDIPSLTNYVTTNTNQTISGIKTFSNEQLFGNGITLTGGYITYTSGSYNLTLNTNILTANRNVYIKDGSGTLAFTSDIPSLSGYVQGSGTTNYHSKFTASGTIGNSLIYDNGTNVTVNNTNGARVFNIYSATADNHLAIYGSAPSVALTDTATGATYQAKFGLATASGQFATGAAAGDFVISCQTGSTIWAYNSLEKMRLDTSGRLGIGTTSPSYLLDVNGTARVTGAATFSSSVTASSLIASSSATTLSYYNTTNASGAANVYQQSGTNVGWIGNGSSSLVGGATTDFTINGQTNINFAIGGYSKAIITSSGNILIGTTSESTSGWGTTMSLAASYLPAFELRKTGTIGGARTWNMLVSNSGAFSVYDANAALDRLNITTSGNVGIGTSSPMSFGGFTNLTIASSTTTNQAALFLVNSNTTIRGSFYTNGNSNVRLGTATSHDLLFDTADTERMRITSSGDLLINQTSGGEGRLRVTQSGSLWNTELFHTYSTQYFMIFRYNTTGIGSIQGNGTTTTYNTTSDYRLKEDLKEFSGLDLISKIKTYDYQWKFDKSRMYGVIAHELQEVISYAVVGEKDDVDKDGNINAQGVDYSKLVPILVKSIQELEAKIVTLESKIN